MNKTTEQDQRKLHRMLRYLRSTQHLGIVLESRAALNVFAYVDASHGVHEDYKGHTGGLVTLGAGPVHVDSSKQRLNSKSSTETEVIGRSDYLSEVVWVRDFLMEQGYDVGPATLYQDNTSAIAMAEKGHSTNKRTRHIAIRFFFVHDHIEKGEVRLEYLPIFPRGR